MKLWLIVSARFQVLFHSPSRGAFHLSLTVLVHYRSLRVFSLGRWASQFPTELACSVVLRIPLWVCSISYTGLSPSPVDLSSVILLSNSLILVVLQPHLSLDRDGLGSSAFARHYSRNCFFSSGYLDVSIPQVPYEQLCIHWTLTWHSPSRVSPFGHLRVKVSAQLTVAYRSAARPSSALNA